MVEPERFKSVAMRCTVAPPARRTNTSNSRSDSLSTGDLAPPSNSASANFCARRGVKISPAGRDHRDGFEQGLGSAALRQKAQCAFVQGTSRVHGVIVCRQRQYLGLRMSGANAAQCFEASHAGHGEVHHHDVGIELEVKLAGGLAGFGLGNHGHIGHGLQQQSKSHAHDGVIIDQ